MKSVGHEPGCPRPGYVAQNTTNDHALTITLIRNAHHTNDQDPRAARFQSLYFAGKIGLQIQPIIFLPLSLSLLVTPRLTRLLYGLLCATGQLHFQRVHLRTLLAFCCCWARFHRAQLADRASPRTRALAWAAEGRGRAHLRRRRLSQT